MAATIEHAIWLWTSMPSRISTIASFSVNRRRTTQATQVVIQAAADARRQKPSIPRNPKDRPNPFLETSQLNCRSNHGFHKTEELSIEISTEVERKQSFLIAQFVTLLRPGSPGLFIGATQMISTQALMTGHTICELRTSNCLVLTKRSSPCFT